MKTSHTFRKSAILFSLLAASAYSVIFACADGFWEYDYDSVFAPEAYIDDETYTPLFYAPSDNFYGIGSDTEYTSRFNDDIAVEWQTFLNGKVKDSDVSYLLLNDSASAAVESLYSATQKKQKAPAPYAAWNLADEKVKGFVEFLHYAKIIEASSTKSANSWDYDEKKVDPVDARIITQVEKLYNTTADPFLKNRYWFQTMKAYFYSFNKQSVVPFFEKTKAAQEQNTLYYRGLSYVAGAHYSAKKYGQSNYLFSVVFEKCPALRTVTTYNFHPQEQADFQASLAMAKTNEEKAALWALLGYYADTKTAIREIYKLVPASPHLNFLLTRLINGTEASINTGEFKSAAELKKSVKSNLDQEALQLVSTIAKEGKTNKPYLWNIAAGYLNVFAGNHPQALQLLEKGEKQSPKSELATKQIRILKLMNTLYSINTMDSKSEGTLLPELTWLYNVCTKDNDDTFRYHQALWWSKLYVASLYRAQQNAVFAELFNPDGKFYRTPANLEAMKTFQSKDKKSPWENLSLGIYSITLGDIYEYQSMLSAYAGKLDDAIAFMQKADKRKDELLYGNPFNGRVKDCHDCDHAATQKVKYSKLSFLQKMKEMQDHVDKNEDVFNNSLLLANAYYNTTYYGNARAFYYGSVMNEYGNYIDPYHQPQLLSCTRASQYYQKAFDAATTAEQKAKCTYMLAKCERNDYYTKNYHSKDDFYGDPDISFLAWNGFKKLKSDYSTTKYYKDVINECGYFAKYVGR